MKTYKEFCEKGDRRWDMWTIESEVVNYLKIEKQDLSRDIKSLCCDFNFDYSDAQTDYFNCGYYFNIETEGIKFADQAPKAEKKAVGTVIKKTAPIGVGTAKTDSEAPAKKFETFETINEASGHKFYFEVREKSVILTGDTYPYKDNIKAFFGGVWNRTLSGWVIKIEHLESLKSIFC